MGAESSIDRVNMSGAKYLKCEVCGCELNKAEAEFIDEDTFGFMETPPQGLKLGSYCQSCFETQAREPLNRYNELVEQAKNVNMFYLSQSRESRFVRRIEKPIHVKDCADREEAVMALAFQAAQLGKNSLVDVDLKSEKIRDGAYQTSRWSGRAIPAQIDEAHLARRFRGTPN